MRRSPVLVAAFVLFALAGHVAAAGVAGYYRWPALHGERVVFTAEGDLWMASTAGGLARRLTTHPGEESQAAFSADGRQIAFVAGYEGGSDVYLMPAEGGAPKRLSFDAGRVLLQGFAPTGEVVYASQDTLGPSLTWVLRLVDPVSGVTRTLPLADANQAAFDADGRSVWFTRFGAHVNGDNARDYRGGSMAQLWRWNLDGGAEAVRLAADAEANFVQPMVWRDRLYVLGDAGGASNLWSLALDGGDRRELTAHRDFQVRSASLHEGRIVYALGADLHLYDIASGEDRLLPIALGSDLAAQRTRVLGKPLDYLGSTRFALSGDVVALTARGHVTLAGVGPKRRVELAPPPGGRLREAVLTANGKQVLAIVDLEGRSEIWRFAADGSGTGTRLTSDGEVHRWRLYPSPDGRFVAHDDKRGRLWLLDTGSGENRLLDSAPYAFDDGYAALAWSSDGSYLAVVRAASDRRMSQIVLIERSSGRSQVLTSDRYESFAPAFSRDGRWLYFLSNRHFAVTPPSPWGDRNTGPFFDRRGKVYALALQPGQRFPFLPPDELAPEVKDDKNGKDKAGTLPAAVFDGIQERLFEVPLTAGNYRDLGTDGERLYLLERDAASSAKPALKVLAIGSDPPKLETFAADVAAFSLSADGKKLLLVKTPAEGVSTRIGDLLIVNAGSKAPDDVAKSRVRIGDWKLAIEPAQEWRQMFDDAWRMHRAFSFDPGMRGQDWDALRARYAPLVERVGDRIELDDLLAQMIAEHGILHSQVRGGDLPRDAEAPQPALLGAHMEQDANGLRIVRIYRSDAELPAERAPLAQPGVDARDGDRLLAVNGRPVASLGDLARALRQQAGQQVLLDLKRGSAAVHRTVVRPVAPAQDATLRYGDWVQQTRERVEQAGGGRIGYLHLRAMGPNDIANFVREFYAQYDRDGLIVDVRRNRGGNIDSWVIEKLLRRAWAFWQPPHGRPYWNMQQSFRGHLVVLADALTYSDGETFAAGVKALGLGPVIGTRTAGAGIWLSDRNRLVDNGVARIAETGQFDAQGRWLIEGQGVAPDIEVDNLPHATARGEDAQLAAALTHLSQRLQEQPVPKPSAQPIPPRGVPAHDGSR